MQDQWDQRFKEEGFAYGSQPNEYFKMEIDKLVPGRLLLIGEGEGRNAVYAAKTGWQVDAFDFSEAAKEKALNFAAQNNVKINYSVQDLNDFLPEAGQYDAAAIIYVHLDEQLRIEVNNKLIKALKPGGALIMEVFDKDQMPYKSGGPKDLSLLYSLEDVVNDFADLDFVNLSKEIINLNEGKYHNGEAVVIRFTGIKVE
ncbi:MAG: class I SAM-dependent methyltransferase [Methanococcaceae archaeon]